MNVGTSRFVVVATIAGLLLVVGSTSAWAQSPNFTDFSSGQSLINRNGNATFSGSALRLTSNDPGSQTGSAWFNVRQPVQNGFTTTFTFQITNPSTPPGDGIAFVIQNASTGVNAIGFVGNGGALGYGDADASTTNNPGAGIASSIAIEFDVFNNSSWDQGSANHVAIQSCGTGKNTSHHNQVCVDGTTLNSTLDFQPVGNPLLADGQSHTVTITYVAPSTPNGLGTLSVKLGENVVASTSVNLKTLLNLTGGDAYVGFTAATGASVENQDILSWTYQAQTQANQTTVFNFPNHNFVVTPDANSATAVQVTPVIVDQSTCNALVQANPLFVTTALTAQCFVYLNPDGLNNRSVMYEVTCPSLGGICSPFTADLGSTYDLPPALAGTNLGFNPGNPYPGWLKGDGGVPGHPCIAGSGPLFVSNQVSFFDLTINDPFTKGKSGGTGSCWVATYNTPHETPTVNITTPANGGNYALGSTVNANYACAAINAGTGSPTGPYLTVPPTTGCTGTVANGAAIDTSGTGSHSFSATVVDSATDTATSTVTYNVVGPTDLAILNLAATKAPVNSTLTYAIGVGDLGGATAVGVTVTDTFPAGLTPQSGSGNNISCAVVNRRLTCTTTSFSCSVSGQTVTCPLGPIAPLSWSSLNGATLQIKAKVTAAAGTTLKDTATVSSSNTDSKLSNNSSTASTLVTAH